MEQAAQGQRRAGAAAGAQQRHARLAAPGRHPGGAGGCAVLRWAAGHAHTACSTRAMSCIGLVSPHIDGPQQGWSHAETHTWGRAQATSSMQLRELARLSGACRVSCTGGPALYSCTSRCMQQLVHQGWSAQCLAHAEPGWDAACAQRGWTHMHLWPPLTESKAVAGEGGGLGRATGTGGACCSPLQVGSPCVGVAAGWVGATGTNHPLAQPGCGWWCRCCRPCKPCSTIGTAWVFCVHTRDRDRRLATWAGSLPQLRGCQQLPREPPALLHKRACSAPLLRLQLCPLCRPLSSAGCACTLSQRALARTSSMCQGAAARMCC